MKKVLALIMVLSMSSIAFGQIPEKCMVHADDPITIDGDLSEWEVGGNWQPQTTVAYGAPDDISDAMIAVKWDASNVYLAVMLSDTDLMLGDYDLAWNGQDDIEIYIDGDNTDTEGYNTLEGWEHTQQWFLGPRGDVPDGTSANWTGEEWFDLGSFPLPPDGYGIEAATNVVGERIMYEARIPSYNARSTGGVRTMLEGCVIGFDVVIAGKSATGYGWMGDDLNGSKYMNAGQMDNYTLVPEPCTMVLLGLGSLALIRRKK